MKYCARIVLANKQIQQSQDTKSIQKSIASVYTNNEPSTKQFK